MSQPSERVGDAERERAAVILQRQVADGRLTLAELSRRLDAARSAVTSDDLRAVLADIPAPPNAQEVLGRIHELGVRAHRGELTRREFSERKHELIGWLATATADEVDTALDGVAKLRWRGMLNRREFDRAKQMLLPLV